MLVKKSDSCFKKILPVVFLFLFALLFCWKAFFKDLLILPADILVGTYYPWRDNIWNNLVAGVPIKNLEISDAVSQFYPWKLFVVEALKEGRIPLWNHLTLSGAPFLATYHSAVLYPLNVIYLLFSDFNFAWNLQCFLQLFLSGLFTFWFLKNLKVGQFGALVGAVAFSLSGYMMNWLVFGPGSQGAIWLPLILLSIDKNSSKKGYRWVLIGSLSLAMMLLAGDFQTPLYSLVLIFFYAIFRRQFLFSLITALVGFLISAAQLLPTVELFLSSIRTNDNYIQQLGYGIMSWKKLISIFVPDFFGNPATRNYWGEHFYFGSTTYVGVLSLIFVSFTIKCLKNKDVLFFWLTSLIALGFAFPSFWSKLPYIFNLPLISTSSANRILVIAGFGLSVLAGFGGNYLANKLGKKSLGEVVRGLIPIWAIYLSIGIGAIIIFLIFRKSQISEGGLIEEWVKNSTVSIRNLILPFGFLGLSTLAILAFVRTKHKLFLGILLFGLCFDLMRFGSKFIPFVDKNYAFPKIKTTEWIKEQSSPFRVSGSIPSNLLMPYGIATANGYESIYPRRYSELIGLINGGRMDSSPGRYVGLKNEAELAKLLNIKYLITLKKDQAGMPSDEGKIDDFFFTPEYEQVFEDKKTAIFEKKTALPRAFMVYQYDVADSDTNLVEKLLSPDFDFSKKVILEEKPDGFVPLNNTEPGRVLFDNYFSDSVSIKTESSKAGILVLLDNDYPGWKAFLDGQEIKIYRANYTFRAVFVPEGSHSIEFKYTPLSFKIGLWISLGSLSGLLLRAIWVFYHKGKLETD